MVNLQDDANFQNLVKRAALVLFQRVKQYNIQEVDKILNSEYPIGTAVTDTDMDVFSLACSLPDHNNQLKVANLEMLKVINRYKPDYNHADKFKRTPLHHAARASNETAISFLLQSGTQP